MNGLLITLIIAIGVCSTVLGNRIKKIGEDLSHRVVVVVVVYFRRSHEPISLYRYRTEPGSLSLSISLSGAVRPA